MIAGESSEPAPAVAGGRTEPGSLSPESEGAKTTAWIVGGSMLGLVIVGLGVWLLAGSVHETEQARDLAASAAKPIVHTAADAKHAVRLRDSPDAPAKGKPHVGKTDAEEHSPVISR